MDLRESIINQTDVSFMLAKHIFAGEVTGDSNLVFSPVSIQIVLGILAAGSEGPSLDQLLCFLKSNSIDDLNSLFSQLVRFVFADGSVVGGPRLSVANGAWIEQTMPLKHSFKHVVDHVFKATSYSVDFLNKAVEVENQVNQWAKTETNGLIEEILPADSVDDSTRLIFANALYFKGAWSDKFNASDTKDHEFHLSNGGSIKAPFMTSNNKQYIAAFDGFKVLKLPYRHGDDTRRFSMCFFLPDAIDGLPSLLNNISSKPGFLNHHIPSRKVEVRNFLIPKFKTSFGCEVSNVLKGLGLTLPFSGGSLTNMVDSDESERLYVSSIFHKAFIEVNEEGTEAAAVTATVIMCTSFIIRPKIDFVADHPFVFLVRDDTSGVVLFIGCMMNPLA